MARATTTTTNRNSGLLWTLVGIGVFVLILAVIVGAALGWLVTIGVAGLIAIAAVVLLIGALVYFALRRGRTGRATTSGRRF
jgi:hypothetical protein